MTDPFLARIERVNYALAALLSLGALLTQSRPVVLGIVVGSTLTCINFFVLRKLVAKWTRDAAAGTSGSAQLLMMPKMIGLMLAVTAAVLLLPLDVIAFAIGYSIFIVSIVGVALYAAITTQDTQQPTENEHHNG